MTKLSKKERVNNQLRNLVLRIQTIGFDIHCIGQDNIDEHSGVYDMLYGGVLDDILGEINAIENLLGFLIDNHKPQTGCTPEENN